MGVLDEAHNWAHQSNLDFYHFTGREEFKRGMESAYLRSWLTNFNFYNYVRPMGQEMMNMAHVLLYMKETNHSQYENHKNFTVTWLNDVLNRVTTPKYGNYYWASSSCDSTPETPAKDNICTGLYLDPSGWLAPPGQKYNVSSSIYPEVQALDIDVYNAYGSSGFVGNGDPPNGCQNGQRWWQMDNRLAQGQLQLYHTLNRLDPSNPIVEVLRLRMMDTARYFSGDAVGDGAYKHNFSNPADAWGWYLYCVLTKDHDAGSSLGAGGTGNGYLLSYIYTFAAENASTPEEKAWWHHMAINQLVAIHTLQGGGFGFVCDREFDPRAQDTVKKFLDSGLVYTPSNYPAGTPYPDPSASFALGSVVPSSVNKGTDTLLTLNGTLFTSTDKVEIGNPAQLTITPTFVSSSKLTLTLTGVQSNQLGVGTFPVRVKQGSTYSNSKDLTIQVVTVLSSISPSAINNGTSSQLFTLIGNNFKNGAQVKVGSLALQTTTFVSSTQLSFTLPGSQISTLGIGTFDVYVQNPDGGQSSTVSLSILPVGSPVLDTYSPIDVEWNTGPTTISLTGSAFQSGAQVTLLNAITPTSFQTFNTTFVNSGLITFPLTLTDTIQLGPGVYSVVVKNPDNKLSNILPNFVIYIPYIAAQSYSSFPIDAPITLTLSGYYFKSGAVAKVGSTTFNPSSLSTTSFPIAFTLVQLTSLGVGNHSLFIQNPAGGQSNTITFTITESGEPEPGGETNPPGNTNSPGDGGGGGGGSGGDSSIGGGGSGPLTCVPVLELCNGVDDDCDAEVDEGCYSLTNTCQNGVKDEGELDVDCGGVCANICQLSIPDSSSLFFLAGINPLVLLIQAFLRLLGL